MTTHLRGGCPHGADGEVVTPWSHSWSEPRRAPLWSALGAGRLGCPARRDSCAAGNEVEGHRGQWCWKLGCVSAAHYARLAVFDHTHPHTHTGTATETSVFRKNSGVGASVDSELACWGSGPEPVTLAFACAPGTLVCTWG